MLDWATIRCAWSRPTSAAASARRAAFYPEYVRVAVAAKALGRPVKWIEDRRENFLATHQERDQYWDVEIAVDANAKILGVRGTLVHETGAYVPWGIVLPWIAATTVPGPYVIPHFKLDVLVGLHQQDPDDAGARRGPARGRRHDGAADGPRRARAEARSAPRCAGAISSSPSRCPTRSASSSATAARSPTTAATIRRARRGARGRRLRGLRARARTRRARQGRYIGIGIGNAVEATGLGPYESATVRVSTSGKIARLHRRDAAGPVAQDDARADRRRPARRRLDDITVVTGDTAAIALGIGTFAARTAVNAGSSVHLAAAQVATKRSSSRRGMMEVRRGRPRAARTASPASRGIRPEARASARSR